MAIAKDIAIHGSSGIDRCSIYISNHEKTNIHSELNKHTENSNIENVLEYAENPDKTLLELDGDEDLLVSGYKCSPETASFQFNMDRDKYHNTHGYKNLGTKEDKNTGAIVDKEEVVAYHLIQSFPKDITVDPRLIHKIGLEFAEKAFPNNRAVISTHMNTEALHNHILENAYKVNGSTKLCITKDMRRQYRAINDELSLEYGLPILLETSLEHTSQSYYEWMHISNGTSWKEGLKSDIKTAISMSKSWEDYIDTMKDSGYEIKERDKYVVYTVPGAINNDSRKVRDKTLGIEYTKESIIKELGIDNELEKEIKAKDSPVKENDRGIHYQKDQRNFTKPTINLYISKYTTSGRVRSDLEILLLKAIKIIKHFMDKNSSPDREDKFKNNPIYYKADIKLKVLEKSLAAVESLGIKTVPELSQRMSMTGIQLSQAKKEVKDLESVLDYSENIVSLIEKAKQLESNHLIQSINKEDFYLSKYSSKEIAKNKAQEMSMTSSQRRDLFIQLQDSKYILTDKYEFLSYKDAKECLDFLKGKTTIQPSVLVDADNNEQAALTIKYKKMLEQEQQSSYEHLSKRPINPNLIHEVQELLNSKNIPLKAKDLNQYQATQVLNCYKDNPFSSPIISIEQNIELQNLLKQNHYDIKKNPEYITVQEFQDIQRYFNKELSSKPSILKEDIPVKESIANQLEELLQLRNDKISIPIRELSQTDAYVLRNFLLYREESPDLSSLTNDYQKDKFINNLTQYFIEDSTVLCEYRDIMNKLSSLGITEDNINTILADQKQTIIAYSNAQNRIDELSLEYKNLRNLSYNVSLADNKAFTRGPLYRNNSEDIEIKEAVTEQEIKQAKAEEQNIDNEIKKQNTEPKHIYSGIPDQWFDRI